MTRPLLVLRPEPGASATIAAARAMGLEAIAAPLFAIAPVRWSPPDALPEAVLLTSANAVRHGGAPLAALAGLPAYAVGAATAAAARQAGFGRVVTRGGGAATAAAARQAGFGRIVTGGGDAEAILALARGDGVRSLLHLAGREHRDVVPHDISIERRIVYAAEPVDCLPEAARAALPGAIALLHSPRAARLFARLADPAGIAIAAISPATLAAAGSGWRLADTAGQPTDASLLAVAAKLCNQQA